MHLFLQKVGFANQINNKNFNNKTNSFAESETDISFTFCLALIINSIDRLDDDLTIRNIN